MKPYELIDGGLYKAEDMVVKYNSNFHWFKKGMFNYAFIGGAKDVFVFTPKTLIPIEPLPLTTEMLEKWGFKLEYDGLTWYDGISNPSQVYVNIAIRKNGQIRRVSILNHRKSFCVDGCEIYYVHELQQALHLCGLHDLANNLTWEE